MSGVGHGSQSAPYDCTLRMAFRRQGTGDSAIGTMTTPTIANSDLPGLLGLQSLRKNRGILDLNTLKVYFAGPGDYDLEKAMPPGTEVYQGELAPSGHMVLPCCEFSKDKTAKSDSSSLTLVAKQEEEKHEPEPGRPSQPPGLGLCYQ